MSLILRSNICTRFNALLGGLLVVILIVGPLQDALFGFVIISNSAVGIFQEWRAKRQLDRLAVVTSPRARVVREGEIADIAAADVVLDDLLEVAAGDQIVVDAVVTAVDALTVDESLLTGESHAVEKAPGDQLLSGSFAVGGWGRARAVAVGDAAYGTQLAGQARQFALARSELRRGTDRLLRGITWVMLPVAGLLTWSQLTRSSNLPEAARGSVAGIVTMVPEGLVLLTSIAFAVGVVRLARHRVLARELPAIEGLARVDVLCIDKTGTLTTGRLTLAGAEALVGDVDVPQVLAAVAAADPAPNATTRALQAAYADIPAWTAVERWPFSSATKWSAVDFGPNGCWVLGAPDVLSRDPRLLQQVEQSAATGDRLLLLTRTAVHDNEPTFSSAVPIALLRLVDELRADAADTLAFLRGEGVEVLILSGDHPRTVAALAGRLGLDGADQPLDARELPDDPAELADILERFRVVGRVSPQQKRAVVQALQRRGHVVAMTGDGVNDVLALKDADVGIAMGAGASATRAVAQLVLLENEFSAVPTIVAEGRRVIANVERVAKLFLTKTAYATILAICVGAYRLPFPFLPRHLTLISSLTIGISGFFLALAPNAQRGAPGFLSRTLRFAIPAGAVAAAATFLMYLVARTEPDMSLATSRTLTTIVLFAVALWVLALLARTSTQSGHWLVGAMAASFVLAMSLPPSRTFFALRVPRPLLWLAAVGVAALAGFALEVGWRAMQNLHLLRTKSPPVS